MKRIEELTAKEKYEILLWADKNSTFEWLCFRIYEGIEYLFRRAELCEDIQNYFHMSIIRPKTKNGFWWKFGSRHRVKAWKKLIEYWKHEAEKES